jgi:4-alpha-glucanotransferase
MTSKYLSDQTVRQLRQLARLHGVLTSYLDMNQRRQEASPESLLAVLRALGVGVERMGDVPAALREGRLARASRVVEPINVAWQGQRAAVPVQLPDSASAGPLRCEWQFEDGSLRRVDTQLNRLPFGGVARADDAHFITRLVKVPSRLPVGYHRLVLEATNDRFETLVVCARERCYLLPGSTRAWGAFMPLYALHSARSWGAGDFGDLAEFISWVGAQGGRFVGTLPLLPAFLDQPCEPSPYSPVSRLCWNEFYLDLTQVPELEECPAARRRLQSSAFQARLQKLRALPLVDYAEQMALKREVLEVLSRWFSSRPSARRKTFERFLSKNPQVADYARFRAVREQRGRPWKQWPERLRHGELRDSDCRPSLMCYHLYAQWLADEQMAAVCERARAQGVELYLDMPLGAHGD